MTALEVHPRRFEALRTGVAYTLETGVRLRLSGSEAFDLLERALPSSLFLKDSQLRQSLLLGEDGVPFADVLVARADEDYLLWIQGCELSECLRHLDRAGRMQMDVRVEDLSETHGVLSLHGPFAWELLAQVHGEDLSALPYLRFFDVEGGWCLRAGRTGEFGYHLFLPHRELQRSLERCREAGEAFGLEAVGAGELRQAALENWFFDIETFKQSAPVLGRQTALGPLSPVELQLQWRLRSDEDYLGAEALAQGRARGLRHRLTAFIGPGDYSVGAVVAIEGRPAGWVYAAGRSPLLDHTFGLALLEVEVALPWLDGEVDSVAIRSVAPPVLRNRSLYVSPARHSLLRKEVPEFPSWLASETY